MIDILSHIKAICKKKLILPLPASIFFSSLLIILITNGSFYPDIADSIWTIPPDSKYVTVTADKLYYSGYNLIKAGHTSYGYYYGLENDKCVFVLVPFSGTPEEILTDYKFTAKVGNPDGSYKKMINSFAEDLGWTGDGILNICPDYLLNTAEYHPVLSVILLWLFLIMLFVSLKKLVPLIIYTINPLRYSICVHKNTDENNRLIKLAEAEIKNNLLLHADTMYLTEHYFVDLSNYQVIVIPLRRIVWCYRMGIISLKFANKIPEFTLFFTLRDGSQIHCRHKSSEDALSIIKALEPLEYGIITGYSEQKKKLVKNRLNKK